MTSSPPLILLFPGAFATADGFELLLPFLEEAGYSTFPVSYGSSNPPDPSTATCANDISAVREDVFVRLVEHEHRDVIVLAHSYGGVVAGAAAKGFDKTRRRALGQEGGVVGLIYVAGNITLENESLLEAVGGAYPPFIKVDKPSKGLALIEPAMDILYNDCDAARAAELDKYMVPHAPLAFETKPSAPAWADKGFDGRRGYVRTADDACNPASLQDMWLQKSNVEWDVAHFQTGHMPFVSQPKALASQIDKFIKAFAAA